MLDSLSRYHVMPEQGQACVAPGTETILTLHLFFFYNDSTTPSNLDLDG